VQADGTVRPVYFYTVDMSEFAVSKLANGISHSPVYPHKRAGLRVTVERGLRMRAGDAASAMK